MRKKIAVAAAIAFGAALTWAAGASSQQAAGSGYVTPQDVFVPAPAPDNRAALERQAAIAQAKVEDLRERVQRSQDEYQARVARELGPRAPESTMAPVPTIPPMATIPPPA